MNRLLLLIVLGFLNSCTPKLTSFFLTEENIVRLPQKKGISNSPCYDPLNYAPNPDYLDHTPVKFIKVNLHYMLSEEMREGFSEEKAKYWMKSMFYGAQEALATNIPAMLPEGNDIPVLPVRHRYVLVGRENDPDDDGCYFHFDDECCFTVKRGKYSTLHSRKMFERYGVQKDSVLNVFYTNHHPDSIISETYKPFLGGVALRNFVKITWDFEQEDMKPWVGAANFNHEVGHIFGLVHAWGYNDGCDDTPKHPLSIRSSNIMDYNSVQKSWTPCQIGKFHMKMASTKANPRKFLEDHWCHRDEKQTITISERIDWNGQKDLQGDLIIKNGGTLKIACRTSIPPNGKIIIEPGGKLIIGHYGKLHQSCGETWQGIEIMKEGRNVGIVEIIGNGKIEDVSEK